MAQFEVRLSSEAEDDLFFLWRFVSENDSVEKADSLLNALEAKCASLQEFPMKGHVPKELSRIGVSNYRETQFKPYRILYEVDRKQVLVHAILDGRRDMETLLQHRLLR